METLKKENTPMHWDDNQVEILGLDEFRQKEPGICSVHHIDKVISKPEFCKAANFRGLVYGTFVIPSKKNLQISHNVFAFCLTADKLYFIDEGSKIRKKVKAMEEEYDDEIKTPLVFLLDFMEYLIREDLYVLQGYEKTLSELGNRMETGTVADTGKDFLYMRSELNALYTYYEQLSNMAQTMEQVVVQSGNDTAQALLSLYVQRVQHLAQMTHTLKESLTQVLDMKQARLSERQNDLVNLLTIVTSVFTPLTLITGWFGMNFVNMRLLKEPWGYSAVIVFCLLLTLVEILVIRKWKIFRKQ
ncbi:CorA family divalent cation transporter [uncultured Faecalibaculum sp.]|uniref:magnesium transporter CorA family protein n=1 Tax=uncultured Faecalibaculum sp. TaxID=1729681 RepID=UPI00261FF10A|nr:CorA family divalent cation transporter [uncultured Faecalibaculum sp.]